MIALLAKIKRTEERLEMGVTPQTNIARKKIHLRAIKVCFFVIQAKHLARRANSPVGQLCDKRVSVSVGEDGVGDDGSQQRGGECHEDGDA